MKILSLLFILIVVLAQDPLQAKSNSQHSNTTNVLISGWKPSNNFSNENKANFKTIEALKKFKRIGRLKLYFKEAAGFAVFPNIAKAGLGFGGSRGSGIKLSLVTSLVLATRRAAHRYDIVNNVVVSMPSVYSSSNAFASSNLPTLTK